MQRITISLDEALGDALDRMVAERAYGSRSEAMRDLVRDGLERWRTEQAESSHCVANLSYVVDPGCAACRSASPTSSTPTTISSPQA